MAENSIGHALLKKYASNGMRTRLLSKFEELQTELGYADYLGVLHRYRL
jgi:hypothetical protein